MEEVIEKVFNFLREGKLEESIQLLIENFRMFPQEVQLEIITAIIESYLLEETEKFKILNEILEKLNQSSSNP